MMANNRATNTTPRCGAVGGVWVAVLSVSLCAGVPNAALAVPVDPQRAFDMTTCDAAKDRLAEAQLGSPLISAKENAEVVVAAKDWVKRLCGADE